MATSRKIGFFLRKKPRSPVGERARNVLRTMPSVRPEIARKSARHPVLAAGRCLPRVRVCVCDGACLRAGRAAALVSRRVVRIGRAAVFVSRRVYACDGAYRAWRRVVHIRVSWRVRAGRAAVRGGARSRRRSRRFCRKSVDPSVFPPYLQEGVRINMRGIRQAPCKTLFCK